MSLIICMAFAKYCASVADSPDLSTHSRNAEHVRRHAVYILVAVLVDLRAGVNKISKIVVHQRNGAASFVDVAAIVDLQESNQVESPPVVTRPGEGRHMVAVKPVVAVPRIWRAAVFKHYVAGVVEVLPSPAFATKPCPVSEPGRPVVAVVARDWKPAEVGERHGGWSESDGGRIYICIGFVVQISHSEK